MALGCIITCFFIIACLVVLYFFSPLILFIFIVSFVCLLGFCISLGSFQQSTHLKRYVETTGEITSHEISKYKDEDDDKIYFRSVIKGTYTINGDSFSFTKIGNSFDTQEKGEEAAKHDGLTCKKISLFYDPQKPFEHYVQNIPKYEIITLLSTGFITYSIASFSFINIVIIGACNLFLPGNAVSVCQHMVWPLVHVLVCIALSIAFCIGLWMLWLAINNKTRNEPSDVRFWLFFLGSMILYCTTHLIWVPSQELLLGMMIGKPPRSYCYSPDLREKTWVLSSECATNRENELKNPDE